MFIYTVIQTWANRPHDVDSVPFLSYAEAKAELDRRIDRVLGRSGVKHAKRVKRWFHADGCIALLKTSVGKPRIQDVLSRKTLDELSDILGDATADCEFDTFCEVEGLDPEGDDPLKDPEVQTAIKESGCIYALATRVSRAITAAEKVRAP